MIPANIKKYFWSYNFEALDLEKDKQLIITQIINLGSWADWRWLAGVYGKEEIKKIVGNIRATEFRPGALKLASLLFSIDKLTYAPRGSNR